MANQLIGQILGSVLGGQGTRMGAGSMGTGSMDASGQQGGSLGGLGGLLGGLLGGGNQEGMGGLSGLGGIGQAGRASRGGHTGAALTALLIPLAMQWVQRSGGISGVLQRFQQKGYSEQASSWVSTGDNHAVPAQAMGDVVGDEELSRLSRQLGVSHEEVAGGMADVLPEVVNHLTPDGHVPPDADDKLQHGVSAFERFFQPQPQPR